MKCAPVRSRVRPLLSLLPTLAVLVAALAAAPLALSEEPAEASEDAPDAFGSLAADVVVEGMTFVASRGETNEFELRATHGLFVPGTRIAHLREMDVVGAADLAGQAFAMRCDHGELDVETNDFLAEGNVEGTIADGREYSAPWVRYDHAKALLYTDAPVVLNDSTGTFRGDGFRYFVRERRFRLLGNVSLVQQP